MDLIIQLHVQYINDLNLSKTTLIDMFTSTLNVNITY